MENNETTRREFIPQKDVYKVLFERYPFDDALDMAINLARSSVRTSINMRIDIVNMFEYGILSFDSGESDRNWTVRFDPNPSMFKGGPISQIYFDLGY
jgi:hypothetical protein